MVDPEPVLGPGELPTREQVAVDAPAEAAELEPRETRGMGDQLAPRDRVALADPHRHLELDRLAPSRAAIHPGDLSEGSIGLGDERVRDRGRPDHGQRERQSDPPRRAPGSPTSHPWPARRDAPA